MHGTIHIIRGLASARQAATLLDLVANNSRIWLRNAFTLPNIRYKHIFITRSYRW